MKITVIYLLCTTNDYRIWSGSEDSSHKMKVRVCFFLEEKTMDEKILKKLFKLANKSLKMDEFPVSAIIYDENGIISCGYNKRNHSKKTTDHAEIIAVEKANKKLKNWNLQNKCMAVTLEPCDMCKTVLKEARIGKVYYLVARNKNKKQYKCTEFLEYNYDSTEKQKYMNDITSFFINKR